MAQRHGTSLSEETMRSRLRTFRVDETVCNHGLKYIYGNRYSDPVIFNLSYMCDIEYWNETKNQPLKAEHIQKYHWVPGVLVCENNR